MEMNENKLRKVKKTTYKGFFSHIKNRFILSIVIYLM